MSLEIERPSSRKPRQRRTTADRLRAALLDLAGGCGNVLSHAEQPWASITFAGSRHRLRIAFDGQAAIAGGEQLVADLPEHEFTLAGHLVADATITGVDHTLAPEPKLVVECEILLLEEG